MVKCQDCGEEMEKHLHHEKLDEQYLEEITADTYLEGAGYY